MKRTLKTVAAALLLSLALPVCLIAVPLCWLKIKLLTSAEKFLE